MLIIIRGNSGSGKSTVAKLLREKILADTSIEKVALVEQDYLRRIVLKEKEALRSDNINLIKQTAEYALSNGYVTILEGIFYSKRYSLMLKELIEIADTTKVYYLDISLQETLVRHKTKPVALEYGERELRNWYKAADFLNVKNEQVISETLTCDEIIEKIFNDIRSL